MLTTDYIKVVTNLLAANSSYTPNYLYVEFTNDSSVSAPTDTQGKEYYDSLTTSGYLRIPITIKPTVSGNQITYTVLVASGSSLNSVEFTNASRIYGVALVSAVEPNNPEKDIVFAREYFPDKTLVLGDNQTVCFSFKLSVFDSVTQADEEYWVDEA